MKWVTALLIVLIATFLAFQSGLVRLAFYELFDRVKGVESLGPAVVRALPDNAPYQRWLMGARNEIPVYEDIAIENVGTVPLRAWSQLGEGINGLYLRFADYQIVDGRIIELPVSGETYTQKQFFEQAIYYISGEGYTLIQAEGESPLRIDWKAGDLFSIPINIRHQHFNSGVTAARMLIISSFPFVLNTMNSMAFVDDNPFVFTDRFDGDENFAEHASSIEEGYQRRNFVENVSETKTIENIWPGRADRRMEWDMAGNSMLSLHVSEISPHRYMKAHRHSSDAFILVLSGQGFSITWPDDRFEKHQRIDWQPGTLFVPPTFWYHQHLNTGDAPARYLAINAPRLTRNLGLRFSDQLEKDLPQIRKAWNKAVQD